MQRHVWGGGSPGATGAAASPEGESVQANDWWKLSTDLIHVFATGFAIIGALLHASLPPPTAEKVMSSHFASPDARSAKNHVNAFGKNKVTATDSCSSICDFESGTGVGVGDTVAEATASGVSTGVLDQLHDGSMLQARNFDAADEAMPHPLGAYHDNPYGQERANEQISPNYGGLSLSASDPRNDESENSAAYHSQISAQALGSGGAIASPTRRHCALGAVELSGGTH